MRISVIMPVCLTPYESTPEPNTDQFVIKSAPDPERKFIRAVDSFCYQTFKDCELIIIADGSERAKEIYEQYYKDIPNIHFKLIPKQDHYSGVVRNTGLKMAKGEIICYLDHDDMFGNDHLKIISDNFNTYALDWIYYDDYIADGEVVLPREVRPEICMIGTSTISHKRKVKVKWGNKYGHDWYMIEKYLLPLEKRKKITIPLYYVCHNSNINVNPNRW
jgi:glycosyltransferase involved in cell wall biosynthesis